MCGPSPSPPQDPHSRRSSVPQDPFVLQLMRIPDAEMRPRRKGLSARPDHSLKPRPFSATGSAPTFPEKYLCPKGFLHVSKSPARLHLAVPLRGCLRPVIIVFHRTAAGTQRAHLGLNRSLPTTQDCSHWASREPYPQPPPNIKGHLSGLLATDIGADEG
ncbi:hypothetical protein NDU88_003301 [Pleurodeles waltl]|uniref:Uncharacterized protein n=1 Tax=Pleurodeles waltl TaxID=8319 RepID=A0AAV7W573_PLEWA|nr:hypothetical protein NDU88_003301 [Pleurodeles waltl]